MPLPFQSLAPIAPSFNEIEYEAFVFPGDPCVPPTITLQPEDESVMSGDAAAFSITATGLGSLTYKWQLSTDGGMTWNPIDDSPVYTGTDTPTLSIAHAFEAMDGNEYRCVVTNCGTTTSDPATLTVAALPHAEGDVSWTWIPAGGTIAVVSAGSSFFAGTWTFPVVSSFGGGSFDTIRCRLYDADNNLLSTTGFNPAFNATQIIVPMGGADHGVLDVLPGSPATTVGSTSAPLTFTG